MIGKRIRHTIRYKEIINAFLKNGFSHFLYRIGLTQKKADVDEVNLGDVNTQDVGVKLRRTLQELGPTFIKLGQMASSRRDQVPKEIAVELQKLQDEVISVPFEEIKRIIEYQLGNKLDTLFATFNEEPLACASIGQVHTGTLHSGVEVAVKVQRPDIETTMETDLEIVEDLTGMLENRLAWAKSYQIQGRFKEFAESLREELDYTAEGKSADRIRRQSEDDEGVHIPKIYWELTTKKVLTMERIKGIKITNIAELDAKGYNREVIAERLANSIFRQVLEFGFFHGDPHPGNLIVMPGNVVSYIDFGMVGYMGKEMRYHFTSLLLYVSKGNAKGIVKTFKKMGIIEYDSQMDKLQDDLDGIMEAYYSQSLASISLGQIISEIFTIAFKYKVEVPSDITILAKVILTLETVIDKLSPDFSIMKAVEPYGEKLIKERYNPKNIAKSTWTKLAENAEILVDLPSDLSSIAKSIKKGKMRLDIKVSDLGSALSRLDKISNRLSFSIILLAFSILMAGLVIGSAISGHSTMLLKLPLIEIGFVIATIMFLFMVYSIFRSGKM